MLINDSEYQKAFQEAVECIKAAQYSAVVSANLALLHRNLRLGQIIIQESKWGNKFIDNLAGDIRREFPDSTGFSVRNLKYMKKFAGMFEADDIDQMGFAGLTWYHHMALMDKTDGREKYVWYLQKAASNGWTRDILVMQIESGLYERQNTVNIQNFAGKLPDKQSELAIQTMKDPYIFDFVKMRDRMIETDTGKFVPEYAGKMNFYLSVLDEQVKGEDDNPSIGLILCKDRNKLVAEYALKDVGKPIGVSEYRLLEDVPEELQDTVPSLEDIESRVMSKYKCE